MPKPRILFAGTPVNAAQTLQLLSAAGVEIAGVLTRDDSIVGRKGELRESGVAVMARELGLKVYKSNFLDDTAREWIASLNCDVGVIVAYGSILKTVDLAIPKFGWLNLHYSLLPEFPGPAPVQHALLQGRKSTGVTVFRLDEGVDTGPIVAQADTAIDEGDNASSLLNKLTLIGADLLIHVLERFPEGLAKVKAQPKGASGATAFKPTRSMARIDFRNTAISIHNLVRAMNPEPMAWFEFGDVPVRVQATRLANDQSLEVGELRLIEGMTLVGCGEGSIELLTVQPAGKKIMSASDWVRGLRRDRVFLIE